MPVEIIYPPHNCNFRQGQVDIRDNWSAVDVWHILHCNADAWLPQRANLRSDIDSDDHGNIRSLSTFPADRWHSLCTAAGWTVYGAVALSWCKDADLNQVWTGWQASGFPLKPLPEFERPARFINPALLIKSRKISELIAATTPNPLAFCAMVASSAEPLEFDLPLKNLHNIPSPQIAAFLKSRMLQKPERTAEEQELIASWSETVRETDYDIWTEAT